MFEPPRRRPLALRSTLILAWVGLAIWSTSVGCLWTHESYLIFQTHRSRFPPLVAPEGLVELETTDGIQLDALSLIHESTSPYWILFCPPSGRTIHDGLATAISARNCSGPSAAHAAIAGRCASGSFWPDARRTRT